NCFCRRFRPTSPATRNTTARSSSRRRMARWRINCSGRFTRKEHHLMNELTSISEHIHAQFVAKNSARDTAISASRELIRHCSEAIRAVHRREWENAEAKLAVAQQAADDLRAVVAEYPDLAHSSYTSDALKEVVEAFATYAIIRDRPLPTPDSMHVD